MSTYREMRRYLGTLAHEIAEGQFKAARPHHHLIMDQYVYPPGLGSHWREKPLFKLRTKPDPTDAGNYFIESLDPYFSTLIIALQTKKGAQYLLEASTEGHSRKPDLAGIETHHAYEVKPDTSSQIRTGKAQLKEFKTLLNQGDREYKALRHQGDRYRGTFYETHCEGKQWTAGIWCPQPAIINVAGKPLAFTYRNAHSSGVIAWKVEHPEKKLTPEYYKLAEMIAADLKKDPSKVKSHSYGREIRHRSPGLVQIIQKLISKDGAIAFFAAMLTLLVVALTLPEVALAALILTIIQEFSPGPVQPHLT